MMRATGVGTGDASNAMFVLMIVSMANVVAAMTTGAKIEDAMTDAKIEDAVKVKVKKKRQLSFTVIPEKGTLDTRASVFVY
jgi:hypothetical protein